MYTRPVSPTEWLYLAAAPLDIQLVVEGDGTIDAAALRHAVAAAATANPGASLTRQGRTWVATSATPMIGTTSGKLWPHGGPEATTSPKLCHVERGDGTITFRAAHAVMDGRGVLAWAADVFRVLRGEQPVGAPDPVTDYGLVDRLGATGRRPRLRPDRAAAPLRGDGHGWLRRTIDGTHPGLVAKIATHLGTGRYLVPVDLRRHDPDIRSTGNLSLPVFLDVAAGDTWEAVQERLLTALADGRELTGGAAERAAYRLPLPLLRRALAAARHRYLCSSIVSHLGRVDPDTFSAPGFAATTVYSRPVHAPLAPMSIVATELPGRTELTMAYRGDGADELFDSLVDAIAAPGLRHWSGNATTRPAPTGTTVVDLFRAQVARTPDATALTGPQGTVTYAELDRRADAVAQALAERGVGRGAVVALLADRSVEAVAGLWGILKAGAAYLPIDPQYPDERITGLLDDARVPVCLAQGRHAHRVRDPIVLDDLPVDGAPSIVVAGADDVAYVIYTSGSTGRPKGVQVSHHSLVNYVTWAGELYRVDAGSRFALFTSLAFDLTGTTIFLPLLAGGSIALVPDDVSHASLRHLLERSGANALKLTPAHLDLIGRLDLAPHGFRVLVVGGEQLKGQVAARAQQVFGPDCRIVNEYGPTEATIGCVVHVFDESRDAYAAGVPIGTPVANTTALLLDAERRHTDHGELYLTGAQLARGYLGRPDLDRARFVTLADGTRAYRTGDLCRLTEAGVLEYLGRTDDQIKIRGYRVEPGEIEAALESLPSVVRAAVVAREGNLCAYVVGDSTGLREHLAGRLPRHLVPAVVVAVPELPYTVNGKVDVGALPDPFPAGERPAVAERDAVEERVAKIWAGILAVDLDRIGPDADFFALGGDSLKLIEMVAAVGAETGRPSVEDSLRDVIGNPTLAAVCDAIR